MNIFKQQHDELLGNRTQVKDLLNTLSKYESELLVFEIQEYINFADDEDEDEDYTEEEFNNLYQQEIPGFQLYVKSRNSKVDYKYYLLDIILPYQVEFPVNLTFNSLNGNKTFCFADIKSLKAYIDSVFKSTEYRNIEIKLNKIYE